MNRVMAVASGVVGLWFLLLASPRSAGEASVKFAFAAVLLLFAYRRFQATPGKTASYTRTEEGPWMRIDTVPVAAPINGFGALLAIVLGGFTIGSGTAYLWVMGLIFACLAALILLHDPRGRDASRPAGFRVGPAGIETGGQLLPKQDIHHVHIRNRFAGDFQVTYDANQGLSTGTLAGIAHRRKTAEVAYRVEVEAAGKAHVLAAGLDEVTARGVATEVGQRLHA